MKESAVQAKIIAALVARGAYVVKYNATVYGREGVPDLLVGYRGRALYLESKHSKYKKPSVALRRLQKEHQKMIEAAGCVYAAVNTVDGALRLLDTIDSTL